jgi:hypothetical protein
MKFFLAWEDEKVGINGAWNRTVFVIREKERENKYAKILEIFLFCCKRQKLPM